MGHHHKRAAVAYVWHRDYLERIEADSCKKTRYLLCTGRVVPDTILERFAKLVKKVVESCSRK